MEKSDPQGKIIVFPDLSDQNPDPDGPEPTPPKKGGRKTSGGEVTDITSLFKGHSLSLAA